MLRKGHTGVDAVRRHSVLVVMQHQADREHPVSPNVQHRCCALGDTSSLCVLCTNTLAARSDHSRDSCRTLWKTRLGSSNQFWMFRKCTKM